MGRVTAPAPAMSLLVRFCIGLLCAGMAVATALILWQLPRGLDVSDESWALDLIAGDRVTVGEPWGFQHLMHPLFAITGENVIVLRVVRLLGYLAVAAVLILIARRVVNVLGLTLGRWWWVFIVASAQIGTVMAFSYPPQYVSYNELSAWLSQLAGGGLVLAIVGLPSPGLRTTAGRVGAAVWFGIGAAVGTLCLAKVSAGGGALVLAIAIAIALGGGDVLRRLGSAVVGGVLAVLIALATGFPLLAYIGNLLSIVSGASVDETHTTSQLLVRYLTSTGTVLVTGSVALIAIVLAFVAVHRASGPRARGLWGALGILAIVLVIAGAALWFRVDDFVQLALLAVTLLAAAIAAIIAAASTGRPARRSRLVLLVVVVAAVPFVSAIGTNNAITSQLLWSGTIYAVAAATGIAMLVSESGARVGRVAVVPVLTLALLAGVSCAQFLMHLQTPYRMTAMTTQTTPTDADHLAGLLLTPGQAEWASWISSTGKELEAEKVPTVAMDAPGALLVFNASPFANPRIRSAWPVSFDSIDAACATGAPDDLFVLQPGNVEDGDDTYRGIQERLGSCGYDFPADFTAVATHPSDDPMLRLVVWRTRS